jgi:hypothetical protein
MALNPISDVGNLVRTYTQDAVRARHAPEADPAAPTRREQEEADAERARARREQETPESFNLGTRFDRYA